MTEEEAADLREGVFQAHATLLDESRRRMANERLVQALVILLARREQEPLRFLDDIRGLALDTLRGSELQITKDLLETQLAKVEGAIIRHPGG